MLIGILAVVAVIAVVACIISTQKDGIRNDNGEGW